MSESGHDAQAAPEAPLTAYTMYAVFRSQRGADGLADTGRDQVAAEVDELLTQLAGKGVVTRWGGALPQYAVGHLERVARIKSALAAVPGLVACGAAFDGVGIPACIGSGEGAATQILGQLFGSRAGEGQ